MGYRSDIAIVFYPERPEDMPVLKLFVKENLPDQFEEKKRNSPGIPSYLIYRDGGLKWYDSYPDVQVYELLFNEWEDKFTGEDGKLQFHYEFVRIGEEPGDIEERGTDTNILYVACSIEED